LYVYVLVNEALSSLTILTPSVENKSTSVCEQENFESCQIDQNYPNPFSNVKIKKKGRSIKSKINPTMLTTSPTNTGKTKNLSDQLYNMKKVYTQSSL